MTTLKVEAKQGEATSTYVTVEQIVRAEEKETWPTPWSS
jgi:hypothetical protein